MDRHRRRQSSHAADSGNLVAADAYRKSEKKLQFCRKAELQPEKPRNPKNLLTDIKKYDIKIYYSKPLKKSKYPLKETEKF